MFMVNDFDTAALSYDTSFTFSNIGKAQREQVYRNLNKLVKNNETLSILELNCGTGEDAKYLSDLGHQVIATDISSEMIRIARSKIKEHTITFLVQDIKTLNENTFNTKFDLIYSNFGGFNCLSKEEIERFFKTVPVLLKENGNIALVIMPKNTLWEQFYFSIKRQFKKVKRRQTSLPLIANVNGVDVNTWYYNPSEIKKSASNFKLKNSKPIGLWVPPSFLEHSFAGTKFAMMILKTLDRIFSHAVFSKYADHYYIELEKK